MSATGDIIDELEVKNIRLQKQLDAYKDAVNRIDDWFEYANESATDREKVHEILDNLTLKLSIIE
jgi:hypothetical protein